MAGLWSARSYDIYDTSVLAGKLFVKVAVGRDFFLSAYTPGWHACPT